MTIKDRLLHFGASLVLERPVRGLSLADLCGRTQAAGEKLSAHLEDVQDSEQNRRQLSHIVGIERWCQHRLQVALGQPFIQDEYNSYRPGRETTWEALKSDFHTTRQATLALIDQLESANPPEMLKIRHNDFGALSVRGWIRYLILHAEGEGMKIR